MHQLPQAEDEASPCNLYCAGEVHVDVAYFARDAVDACQGDLRHLTAFCRDCWATRHYPPHVILLAVEGQVEATPVDHRYPQTARGDPAHSLPYRVRYRVERDPQPGDTPCP